MTIGLSDSCVAKIRRYEMDIEDWVREGNRRVREVDVTVGNEWLRIRLKEALN